MSACPNGHETAAVDWCDVCGARIGAAAPGPGSATAPPGPERAAASSDDVTCPHCAITQDAGHRFCEVCGADMTTAPTAPTAPSTSPLASAAPPAVPPAAAGRWEVTATADRDYFDRLGADGVDFPIGAPTRSFPLADATVLVGRRSARRGIEPQIDLSGAPEDPGVSHAQCSFVRQPDATFAVVDGGSTNGTRLNGSADPLPVNLPHPVADGDRVHVGAWTTLTVHRR